MARRQPILSERGVKVYKLRPCKAHPSYKLEWVEPGSGVRRSRSSGTKDERQAEAARVLLEHELNQDGQWRGGARGRVSRTASSSGHVYLVEGGQGQFKIGRAVNPASRIVDLQIASAVRLVLVHFIITDDMPWLERQWHLKFNGRRLLGEWFSLDAQQVDRFKRVLLWYRDSPPIQGSLIDDPWYQ